MKAMLYPAWFQRRDRPGQVSGNKTTFVLQIVIRSRFVHCDDFFVPSYWKSWLGRYAISPCSPMYRPQSSLDFGYFHTP